MTKALEILGQNPVGLSAKEIATRWLGPGARRSPRSSGHITYKRLCHSLAVYERAGIGPELGDDARTREQMGAGNPNDGNEQAIFQKLNPTADFVHRMPQAKSR